MYEELVKRLRRMLDWELCDYDHNFKFADETIAEAADAIEELSRIVKEYQKFDGFLAAHGMFEPPKEET